MDISNWLSELGNNGDDCLLNTLPQSKWYRAIRISRGNSCPRQTVTVGLLDSGLA